MASRDLAIDRLADGDILIDELRAEHRATLIAPLDDMWASFADDAAPHALRVDGTVAGGCSIDGDGVLHRFFVRPAFEGRVDDLFATVLAVGGVRAAIASTVDPWSLVASLGHADRIEAVALLYHHEAESAADPLEGLSLADGGDLLAAVAFVVESTGDPADWTTRYLGERIERGELHLFRRNDRIAAIGESRIDQRSAGHAHLGVIVGPSHRGRGLASRLLTELVGVARRSGLAPLCSTEPGNLAALHAIHRAGFRSRHRVFQLSLAGPQDDSTRSTR